MTNLAAAQRYASALFQLAQEQGALDAVIPDVRSIRAAWEENPGFAPVLEMPNIAKGEKLGMMRAAFGAAHPMIFNAMALMLDKHRTAEIGPMLDAFLTYADDALGTAEATVYTARPLSDAERTELSAAFSRKIGKRSLRIREVQDPSLIGGIRLRIGNRIYDSSLSSRLESLKRGLIG